MVETPASEGAPEPIRQQIIDQSGFSNIDEVIAAAPDATQVEPPRGPNGRTLRKDGTERAPKGSRKSRVTTVDADDPMSDPKYKKAIAGMNFYGAPRIIKRSFKTVSVLANDSTLDLDEQENEAIDDYFYAVSKHTTFDPMASLVGRILLLILLIGEIVVTRVLVRSKFGREIQKLIMGKREEDESQVTTLQDNGGVRSSSIGEDAFS
jgi:hypothetical protein